MKRGNGTHDSRDAQPILGYEFFENNFRCTRCFEVVPDDSLTCPFCLAKNAPKNPAPPRSRKRKINSATQERLPLYGSTRLD
jgi:hypothetical protein